MARNQTTRCTWTNTTIIDTITWSGWHELHNEQRWRIRQNKKKATHAKPERQREQRGILMFVVLIPRFANTNPFCEALLLFVMQYLDIFLIQKALWSESLFCKVDQQNMGSGHNFVEMLLKAQNKIN